MIRVTASNIIAAIQHLPRNQAYQYVNLRTHGLIEIVDITHPEGPITIKRYNPSEGEASATADSVSISSQLIWRIANSFTHHSRNREKEKRIILGENGEIYTTMAHFAWFHSHLRFIYIVR